MAGKSLAEIARENQRKKKEALEAALVEPPPKKKDEKVGMVLPEKLGKAKAMTDEEKKTLNIPDKGTKFVEDEKPKAETMPAKATPTPTPAPKKKKSPPKTGMFAPGKKRTY